MRHLIRNTVLAIAVVLICAAAIYPPEQNLRRGRDLAGGVSLIYAVDVPQGADARQTITQTIDVLKDRVDPQGKLEISFVQQGRNRIEVQMPLPNDAIKALRAAYIDHIEAVTAKALDVDEVERVMRLTGPERSEAFRALSEGSAERAELLRVAAEAYDAAQAAREAYDAAAERESSGATDEPEVGPVLRETDALLDAAGAAADAYESARDAAIASTIDGEALKTAIELSDKEIVLYDPASKEQLVFDSPRKQAIERLRERHPGANADIDKAIELYAVYESQRKGLDDPSDLIRLLSGAGVLDFRIAVDTDDLVAVSPTRQQEMRLAFRDRGPRSAQGEMRWFALDDLKYWYNNAAELRALDANPEGFFLSRGLIVEPRDGQYYMLLWDTEPNRMLASSGDWGLTRAFQSIDSQSGKPSIAFELDARGAIKMGAPDGESQRSPDGGGARRPCDHGTEPAGSHHAQWADRRDVFRG